MDACLLKSAAQLRAFALQKSTLPALCSPSAPASQVSISSRGASVPCSASWKRSSTGWRHRGYAVERTRRASGRARAADSPEAREEQEEEKVDYRLYNALMRGGEEVMSVMKEMVELLQDITNMGEQGEQVAVEMAATGVVGQRLDKLDESFLMALDYMIQQAEHDDRERWLLEVIKDVVLAQLTQKFPSQVQIVGILCRTPDKDARLEVLRRCAGGGGTFDQVGGGKIELPAVNLNDVGDQADDIIASIEEKAKVEDRRLLARLVLAREEARSMLGGGLEDERIESNKRKNLPQPEVEFLTKITGMKPGPELHKKLARVLAGQDEGQDILDPEKVRQLDNYVARSNSIIKKKEPPPPVLPVRPGLLIQTVNKVLQGMYSTNTARGVTVQQMEWIRKEIMEILQKMAFLESDKSRPTSTGVKQESILNKTPL